MPEPAPTNEESIGALIVRLIAEARALATAEFAFWRALAGERSRDASLGLGYAVAAVVLVQAAAIALLVGLLIALAPLVGPWWATAILVTGALLAAAVFARAALGKVRRATRKPPRSDAP